MNVVVEFVAITAATPSKNVSKTVTSYNLISGIVPAMILNNKSFQTMYVFVRMKSNYRALAIIICEHMLHALRLRSTCKAYMYSYNATCIAIMIY